MHLANEIQEQPSVLRRLLSEQSANVRQIAAAVNTFAPSYVHIAARGTSDNAARYAQYLMGTYTRLPVMLATPSLHTLYDTPPQLSRSLTIGVSQSGKAEDVRQVIADANADGAITLAITNDAQSPLAKEAQYHIELCAGEEVSIAATKTYTAQLMAMAMLTAEIADNASLRAMLADVPAYVEQVLVNAADVPTWAQRYRYAEHFIAIGRGFNYATAFEIGLKVKELCYTTGGGYSEADFRHGPIAIVGRGYPVLIVAVEGKTLDGMLSLLEELKKREAETIVLSNNAQALAMGTRTVALPAMPEQISPLVAVVPGQILGMNLALAKNYPVDKPRGLSKVTVTL